MTRLERDYSVDSVKGICIILMVIGHSGCPESLSRFIYLFHMPAFFFISGYLFNLKYIDNKRDFVLRRLKTLYLPFVLYSLLFLAFHNLLASIHVYANEYGLSDFVYKSLKIISLSGSEQLLGGLWFLKELLYSSIFSLFIIWSSTIIKIFKKHNQLYIVLSILLLIVLCSLFPYIPIRLPAINSKTLLATAYFLFGFVVRQNQDRMLTLSKWIPLGFFLFLCVCSRFVNYSIDTCGKFTSLAYVLGCLGSLALIHFSNLWFAKQSFLSFAGKHSLDILIWHFSSFKLVTLIIILYYSWDISHLSVFPCFIMDDCYWWLLYASFGILLPLFFICCVNESRCHYTKL